MPFSTLPTTEHAILQKMGKSMIGKKDLTMRSSGLGGCNPKVVGGSFWFVLSVVSAMPVEAPKPLNAGVKRLGAAMNKGVNEVFRSMVSSLRVWKKWVRGFGIVPERLLSRGLQKAKVMPC